MEVREVERVQGGVQRLVQDWIKKIGGAGWHLSQAEAVARLKAGDRFYIVRGGQLVFLEIARSPDGAEYLKSRADQVLPQSLLRLRN